MRRFMQRAGLRHWEPLVPEAAFSECVDQAVKMLVGARSTDTLGDYLEFGVSRGTSMSCVDQVTRSNGLGEMRLIGFDSFKGLPPEAGNEGWKEGDYASNIGATRRYLKTRGVNLDRVTLVKGWFKDTLNAETTAQLGIEKASLIMVDCDIYSASKDALFYCAPLIKDHAVIMFDDWGWREALAERGQKEAFDEFLTAFGHFKAFPMPSYFGHARVFFVENTSSAN